MCLYSYQSTKKNLANTTTTKLLTYANTSNKITITLSIQSIVIDDNADIYCSIIV